MKPLKESNPPQQADGGLKQKTTKKEQPVMQEKTLNIEGMSCGHCEARVRKALENLDGVSRAVVSHESKTAVVTLEKHVPDEVLRKAVEDEDYQVLGIS